MIENAQDALRYLEAKDIDAALVQLESLTGEQLRELARITDQLAQMALSISRTRA